MSFRDLVVVFLSSGQCLSGDLVVFLKADR